MGGEGVGRKAAKGGGSVGGGELRVCVARGVGGWAGCRGKGRFLDFVSLGWGSIFLDTWSVDISFVSAQVSA